MLRRVTKARSPLFHAVEARYPRTCRVCRLRKLSRNCRASSWPLALPTDRARASATLFAETHRDGVATHGLNRFPRFVRQIKAGRVKPDASPVRGRPLRTVGAVGRAARPGQPERDGSDRSRDRAGARARAWAGGAAQHESLDARRHLRLAGRTRRLRVHRLDQHDAQHARLGRCRIPGSETTRSSSRSRAATRRSCSTWRCRSSRTASWSGCSCAASRCRFPADTTRTDR